MTKIEWYEEYTDQFGAPALFAQNNTTYSVSLAIAGESGMK